MRPRISVTQASILTAFLLAGCGDATRDANGQIQNAGAIDAFAMRVGDCFDDAFFDQSEVSDVAGVPCADPHDNEVYALFDIGGDTWPGDDQVEGAADSGCYDRFEAAIGKSYEESVLDFTSLYPTQQSWNQMNDREVICVVYHMDQIKLTGSALKSGI